MRRDRDPSAPGCEVPHAPSQNEREKQRQKKNRKKGYRQHFPLCPLFAHLISHTSARGILIDRCDSEYCSRALVAGSELMGSVCLRPNYLRLRIIGNLAACAEGFNWH